MMGVKAADLGMGAVMDLRLISWYVFENFQPNGTKISLQTTFSILDRAYEEFFPDVLQTSRETLRL